MSANDDKTIKITDVEYLDTLLPKEIRQEYSIGMHGFDGTDRYWRKTAEGGYELDIDKIQETKENILNKGLNFKTDRRLLSTITFADNDLSSYITSKGYYSAGGVIVALPKVLRSESGKEIFVGGPNEQAMQNKDWDRNHDVTSLSELVLPEEGVLDPMFVIGSYIKKDDGIEVVLNKEHLSFKGGRVSDEYFKTKQEKLKQMKELGQIETSVLKETDRQKEEFMPSISLTDYGSKSYRHFGTRIAENIQALISKLKNMRSKSNEKEKTDISENQR